MPKRVDLYKNYVHFAASVLTTVRLETYGVDIGQNGWTTAEEYDRLVPLLNLRAGDRVLEVARGSGGPARHLAQMTGCKVTGIDVSDVAVTAATQLAEAAGDSERVTFQLVDATGRLPFEDDSFNGAICIDAMNHMPNRLDILREWCRVLRTGARALFTDPVVITGPVTNDELLTRSSIGLFVFIPPEVTERYIEEAGFGLVERVDVTENAVLTSRRWCDARASHRDELIAIEGEEHFEALQAFFDVVHRLTSERRLSRIAFVIEKR